VALERVDAPTRRRIASAVITAVAGYERDGAVRVPGVARCIVGTR